MRTNSYSGKGVRPYSRSVNEKKIHITVLSITAACLIIFVILTVISVSMTSAQTSQSAAKRWGKGSTVPYAQVSCFLTADSGLIPEQIKSFGANALEKIYETVQKPDNPQAKLFIDAYSTEAPSTKMESESSSIDVQPTAIGGYFFYIHDFQFVSGAQFYDDDIMLNRVVIDTDAAWQLFGSNDVVGKRVWMYGKEFQISGVVDRKRDKLTNEVYGKYPRIYMAFETYRNIDENVSITCYETVMPNPIRDFAVSLVKDGVGGGNSVIVENSSRYSVLTLGKMIPNLARSGITDANIIIPWWENIASVVQFNACVILIFQIVTGSVILASIIGYIVYFYIRMSKVLAAVRNKMKF